MPDAIACTFFAASWDRNGTPVVASWDRLAARCARHLIGNKDGPALAVATFNGPRGNASLVERSMVALDIEASRTTGEVPIDPVAMAGFLAARRVRAVIWSTYSHTPAEPRYRVLLPLSRPLPYRPDVDPFLSAAAALQLRCHGVSDPSKFGAASLFYLPRHVQGHEHFSQIIAGDDTDADMLLTMATTLAERVAQTEAEVAARRRANALPPAVSERIQRFNDAHPLPELLARYGYVRDGTRWRSRYQHGQGATSVMPDGRVWTSFSGSDADAGVGQRPARPSSQCACWGDAFALFVHYEHGGNFRAALSAIGGNDASA